jgi:hypothetical protein
MIYYQNLAAINRNLTHNCEHVQKESPLNTKYQVMLKSSIIDTVNDVEECVPKNSTRVCKDINTSWP